ncbi:MAG TPA: hypothetical protein VFB06_29505 [Streptosporangiaceae bacterium]|nr:hypothetical protein [Streptosporangiaceae bacterium]
MTVTTTEADPVAPLTGAVTADDITAAAEAHRRAAEGRQEDAERDQIEAEELLAAARAHAERIVGEAEAAARPLAEAAALARREAAALAERARQLGSAAALAVKAEAQQAAVRALEDERDELAAKAAGLASRLAELDTERRAAETELTAAREEADLERMTSLRNRIGSIGDLAGTLRAQRAPLLARLDAIGDGEMSPIWPQKLLAEARRVADSRSVRDALNQAFPDRPEAVRDREREEFRLTIDAQRERIAEEAAAQKRSRQSVSVNQAGLQTVIRRN